MTRALATLVGAAVAGGLLWVAAQVGADGTGGYWARIGIVAAAGLALALARLPDVGVRTLTPSLPTFVLAFLPALVAAGWVIVASQPAGSTARGHVLGWSGDIGVSSVVSDLTPFAWVLAFGLGTLLGLVFERRAVVVAPTAVDDPYTATSYDRDGGDTVVEDGETLGRDPVDDGDTVVTRRGPRRLLHH